MKTISHIAIASSIALMPSSALAQIANPSSDATDESFNEAGQDVVVTG